MNHGLGGTLNDLAPSGGGSRLLVLMFTDLVGSTAIKDAVGTAAYLPLLQRHDALLRRAIESAGGRLQQDTGDGGFAVFETASQAVTAALEFQRGMKAESWPVAAELIASRVGIHLGEVAETAARQDGGRKLVGMAIDLAARVMSLGTGGQILMTRAAFDDARQFLRSQSTEPNGQLQWVAHGQYLFRGAQEAVDVFEVGLDGQSPLAAPPDSEKARRAIRAGDEKTLGWRPATGLSLPGNAHWVIERKVGEGGFGEVWLARHAKAKTVRVFKFCFDAERLRALKREVALFRLIKEALGDRRDIARVIDWMFDEPPYFIEMDHAPNGNLADWAKRVGGLDRVPMSDRIAIVAKVAAALAAAHSVGILHKDVKPSNVLMATDEGGAVYPRLTDFGIGILTERDRLRELNITAAGFTATDITINDSSRTGTRMYAPPESLAGNPHTVRGDVYSLGVMLYQMTVADLTRPLGVGWERNVADELIREDIAACVEGEPERRLATAQELADRLSRLESRRADRRRDERQRDAARRRLRMLRLALTAVCVLLPLATLALVGLVRERGLRSRAEGAERLSQGRLLESLSAGGESGLASGHYADARASFVGAWDVAESLGLSTEDARSGVMETLVHSPPPLVGHDTGGLGIDGLAGQKGRVNALVYSPDGRQLYSAGEDQLIREWDSLTGRLISSFAAKAVPVSALAVAADGKTLASGFEDGTIILWDLRGGRKLREVTLGVKVQTLAFSQDAKLLVWATSDGRVGLDLVPTLAAQWVTSHDRWARAAFSPDGEHVASVAGDGLIHVFDLGGKLVRTARATSSWTTDLAYTSDGQGIAVCGWQHELTLFEWKTARVRPLATLPQSALCVACSPDRHWVAVGSVDRSIYVFDAETGICSAVFDGHRSSPIALRFAPDGRSIASSSEDGAVNIWPLPDRARGFGHLGEGVVVACLPGDQTLLTGNDGPLRVVDIDSGQTIKTLPLPFAVASGAEFDGVRQLAVSADGRVAFEAFAGNLVVYELATTRAKVIEIPVELKNAGVTGVAVSARGSTVMATFDDAGHSVVAWDVAKGVILTNWKSPIGTLHGGAVGAEGGWILAGGSDCAIARWDVHERKAKMLSDVRGDVYSLALSGDERRMISGGLDRRLSLWDVNENRRVAFGPFGSFIKLVAIDGTGSRGAVYESGSIDLWRLSDYPHKTRALARPGSVLSLSLSRSGRVVAAAGEDVQVWDLGRAEQLRAVARRLQARRRDLDRAEPDGAVLADLGVWNALAGNDGRAIECLEKAASQGVKVPSMVLARSLWRSGAHARAVAAVDAARANGEAPDEYLSLFRHALITGAAAPATQPRPVAIRPQDTWTMIRRRARPRDSKADRRLIDLSDHYNGLPNEGWLRGFRVGTRADQALPIPMGIVELAGIEFDVRGVIQLQGNVIAARGELFPSAVRDIKVGQRARTLHFLHSTQNEVIEGSRIGSYVVHFSDGHKETVPIVYGRNVRDWWFQPHSAPPPSAATLAWTGKNKACASAGYVLQIYATAWENPTPDVVIDTIDFVSAMGDSAPFLLAITAEQ